MLVLSLLFHFVLAVELFRVPPGLVNVITRVFGEPLPEVPTQISKDLTHMVVLVHGLNTDHTSMAVLRNALQQRQNNFLIVESMANNGKTQDGIREGIDRLTREVVQSLKENPQVTTLSVVAHSLGGIYSRGMIKNIAYDKSIKPLEFKHFVAFASPMLSSQQWNFRKVLGHRVAGKLAQTVAGKTGKELALLDHRNYRETVMAGLLSTQHLEALGRFENRVLISNMRNDAVVSRATSALEPWEMHPLAKQTRKNGDLYSKHTLEQENLDTIKNLLVKRPKTASKEEIHNYFTHKLRSNLDWTVYNVNLKFPGSAHVAVVDRLKTSGPGRQVATAVINDFFYPNSQVLANVLD